MALRILASTFFLCSFLATSRPPQVVTIDLKVGSSLEVTWPQHTELKVSRKGVVHFLQVDDEKWQLSGLRKGLVLVELLGTQDGFGRRYFLSVEKTEEDHPLPKWLCQREIRCQGREIRGTFASFWLALRALIYCAKNHCLVDYNLTPAAKKSLIDWLKGKLPEAIPVSQSLGGLPTLILDCLGRPTQKTTKFIDRLTQKMVAMGMIHLVCEPKAFRLWGRFVVTQRSNVEQIGMKDWDQNSLRKLDHKTIGEKLQALIANRKAEVIGAPDLKVLSGKPINILSGSEFKIQYQSDSSDNAKEGWKQTGLDFHAQVSAMGASRARVGFKVSVKSHLRNSQVDANLVQSEVSLPLDTPRIVAITNVSSDSWEEQSHQIFGKIPILSPLFHLRKKSRSNSVMLVWLRVSEGS